jgi:hypothetical protein
MKYRILFWLVLLFFFSQNVTAQEVPALRKIEAPSFVITYEYNKFGWVISETKVIYASDWASYKFEYEYDNKGNITLLKQYRKELETWDYIHHEICEYNSDNQIVIKKMYDDYGSGFRFTQQYLYSYQTSVLESIIQQNVSSNGENFYNNSKQNYYYNDDNQLAFIKEYAWVSNDWMFTEVFDYEYNDFGNILNYSHELLFDDVFFKEWRYYFVYNEANKLKERQRFTGSGLIWSPKYSDSYIYYSESLSESETVLYPNIYKFDALDFQWFPILEKLIKDDYWLTDCGGTSFFVESANYSYLPIIIEEPEEENGIHHYKKVDILVYPNPAGKELRIANYELRITGVEIIDVVGRKQKAESRRQNAESRKQKAESRKQLGDNEWVFDISRFSPGIYFVKIYTEKETITKKIIKQ